MANGTITIRTNAEIKEKIIALANAMDRSRNWVIEDALKYYIEKQSWQVEGILNAIESIEEGKGIDCNDVFGDIQNQINKKKN